MNKSRLSFVLIALMVSSLVLFGAAHFGSAQSGTTFQGWQVENGGGQYSQNNGIMSLSGNGGTYVILYEQISPTTDFTFSLQVNAATLEGFAIELRSSLPFAGSTQGVNFELGARDGGTFSLARYSSGWTWNEFVNNIKQNVNYTMILSVNKNPFKITTTVLDQNGNSLGSYTASDMTNFAFNTINYLGFGVLESGGNYSVKNISGVNISIPARQWVVDSQGSGDFTSIRAAINASNSGDTIWVKSGTYFDHPLVSKSLALIGQSRSSTIIDGQGQDRQLTVPGLIPESSGSIIAIVANNVTINGFTIQNSRAGGSAIWLQGYNYTTISNNTVANNGDGIRVLNSTGNNIINNIIRNNPYTSVGFDASYNNSVTNNTIANNYIGVGAGILSHNNTFSYNNVTANSYGFKLAMYNSTFFGNNITGNNYQVAFSGAYTNSWDNGASVGGNLWSDYLTKYPNAAQIGNSGIGNTPYVIDSNNKDNYPLWTTQNISPTPTPTPSPATTPTQSPKPTSTPNPTPTPTSVSTLPAPTITVSCQSSASYSNFKVEITGALTANGVGISNVPVLLSYSVNEGKTWTGLTTAGTDRSGDFSAVWFPSASGTYLLNAQWTGNSTFLDANTTINFAVLPYQEQSVFSVSSNSTITAFAFNSTSQELSFSVNGSPGTIGYVDIYVPKSLINDISSLKVYLDGNQLAYTTQSQGDSWLVSFTYHHSIHEVVINLSSASSTSFIQSQLGVLVFAVVAIAAIAIVTVVLVLRRSKKSKD